MIEQLAKDPWLQSFSAVQFYASIAAWIVLVTRWRRHRELLPYAPRRPVPWGPAGAMLAVAFTAMIILSALAPVDAAQNQDEPNVQDRMLGLAASMVVQSLGPILLLIIAATSKANSSDIGLPMRSAAAWGRDIAIGIIACLAAILPVGLVLNAVHWILRMPDQLTKHQLVEMIIQSGPDVALLTLATVMAVVVAPIAEEITYRLLLQGWLEKWEDREFGWRNPPRTATTSDQTLETESGLDTPPEFADESSVEQTPIATTPPKRGVGGLPYGWTPILLSSMLFAFAHFGYGPEPAPLFVLALFLGYCYQRTHRIIPCIVAHGLFNLLSMIALWRIALATAE